MKDKVKLSLGDINSLKGLVGSVQQDSNSKKDENTEEQQTLLPSESETERWNNFVQKANNQQKGTAKSTVYIPESLKLEMENLKNIEGLEKIPLSTLIATVLDDFILEHLSTIKKLVNKKKSRF